MVEDVVAHVLLCSGPERVRQPARSCGGLQFMLTEIVRRIGRIEIAGPPIRVGAKAFAGPLHLPAQAGKR